MDTSLSLALVIATAAVSAAAGESPRVVAVADIEPSAWLDTVVALHGPPASESQHADFVELLHGYDRLEVGYFESQVVHLRSTNPTFCTEQGLCPGDPAVRMESLYGAPRIHPSRPDVAVYWQSGPDCWYEFKLSSGVVTAVGVACQP